MNSTPPRSPAATPARQATLRNMPFITVILAVATGAGAVSALVSLVRARHHLPKHPWLRGIVLLAVIVFGTVVTIASYQNGRPSPAPPTATAPNNPAQVPPRKREVALPAVPASAKQVIHESQRVHASSPRVHIATDSGEDDLAFSSSAEQATCVGCRVRGVLSVKTTVEHQLQDLVTASLSLSLTVTQPDGQVRAFTLTSRGGGFTRDAAIDQARSRLTPVLTERLRAAP